MRAQSSKPGLTEREEDAVALRQRLAEYQLILERSRGVGIVATDPDLKVTNWSRGAAEMTGYSSEEMIHCDSRVLFTPEDRAAGVPDRERQIAEQTDVATDDRWHMRKDGSRFWASGMLMALREQDRTLFGFVKVLLDRTDQRKQREELERLADQLRRYAMKRDSEARDHQIQLQHAVADLIHVEDLERRRIRQTLHDHLQQLLVAARMQLAPLQSNGPEECRGVSAEVDRLIVQSIDASRSLAAQLTPPMLDEHGLVPALHWLAGQFARDFKFAVEVKPQGEVDPIEPSVRTFLFHAVREVLFNAVKHSGVNRATVRLAVSDNTLTIAVEDRGVGFDFERLAARQASGEVHGLMSLKRRIEMLGGRLRVEANQPRGTRIILTAPRSLTPEPQQDI